MLLCCSPKLNWIPKNPRFMFRICQNESRGLSRNIVVLQSMSEARRSASDGGSMNSLQSIAYRVNASASDGRSGAWRGRACAFAAAFAAAIPCRAEKSTGGRAHAGTLAQIHPGAFHNRAFRPGELFSWLGL